MSDTGWAIRDATEHDVKACAEIYGHYVVNTAATFETEVPDASEMARRISAAQATHAWIVLEADGQVIGYAYGQSFKSRSAYRWSCEVSVYLEPGSRGVGGGRQLYEALLARLAERGYRTAVAGMTLPNEASVGLHRAMGFEPVGIYRSIGWKLGSWHDVAWMQRSLSADADPPGEPTDI